MTHAHETKNKVVILFPWGIDIVISRDTGAGIRVGLLPEFLHTNGYAVTVVGGGQLDRQFVKEGIYYQEYCYPSNKILFCIFSSIFLLGKVLRWPALLALLYYTFYRIDRVFINKIKSISASADIIFLEYPFWANLVEGLEKRTVLTNHDIIAHSWTKCGFTQLNKLLYSKLIKYELSAMLRVRRTVFVSDVDRLFFDSLGLKNSLVIPNPAYTSPSVGPEIFNQDSLNVQTNSIYTALFVGSGWYPNRDAADIICKVIAPAMQHVSFLIAGECGRWVNEHPGNVKILGVLPSAQLEALYQEATFAIIPLKWGSGSSLKALEAMKYGKVIVSTPIGIRGIAFEPGVHGVVCNDVTDFPSALNELIADKARCERLSSSAKLLAVEYDFNNLYSRYLQIFDELDQS